MSTIEKFEDIEAWQTARELTNQVYEHSSAGAFSRDYGLLDQMRRAAVSIMSNIAEGFESRTEILFLEFLGRAKGSAGELRSQLYVARDADYISDDKLRSLQDCCAKCSSQISRFMDYLKRSNPNSGRNVSTSERPNVIGTSERQNVTTSERPNDVSASDSGSSPQTFRHSDVRTFRRSS